MIENTNSEVNKLEELYEAIFNGYEELKEQGQFKKASIMLSKLIKKLYFEEPNAIELPIFAKVALAERQDLQDLITSINADDIYQLRNIVKGRFSEMNSFILLKLHKANKIDLTDEFRSLYLEEDIIKSKSLITKEIEQFFFLRVNGEVEDSEWHLRKALILIEHAYPNLEGIKKAVMNKEPIYKYEEILEELYDRVDLTTNLINEVRDAITAPMWVLFISNWYLGKDFEAKYFLMKAGKPLTERSAFYQFYRLLEKEILIDDILQFD